MVSYVRTGPNPNIAVGTTGGGVADLPNYGVSLITATSSEVATLRPPEAGIRKTLICNSSSTTITPLVRGSTAQTVTFASAMGANTALPTMFTFAATRSTNMNTVVELLGLSSVAWAITSVYPIMTTGIGGGSIVLSTT